VNILKKTILSILTCLFILPSVTLCSETNAPPKKPLSVWAQEEKVPIVKLDEDKQTTNTVTSSDIGFLKPIFMLALNYIVTNGTVSTGYGMSIDGNDVGVILSESITIDQLSIKVFKLVIAPGVEHSTFFNMKADRPDLQLVGLNLIFHWFKTPPFVQTFQEQPVAKQTIFLNLTEWYLQPSIDYPVDKFVNTEFGSKNIIFGIKTGWKFK
jgi:hypothetical protein